MIAILLVFSISSIDAQEVSIDRDLLINDTRQLADIIENVHPDPYIIGGGKIAFHRRLQQTLNAIPDRGMTIEDFYGLLVPFVAAIGDGHTALQPPPTDNSQPGGIPFGLRCFDSSLYVRSVVGEQYTNYLGGKLVSVEGIPFDELLSRFRKLKGTQNLFNLIDNMRPPLWYGNELPLLIPEWHQREDIRLKIEAPTGETEQLVIPVARDGDASTYVAGSEFKRPSTAKSDFNWDFVDSTKETALLVVRGMSRFRELLERKDQLGISRESTDRLARRIYKRYHGTEPPDNHEDVRAGVPSATELFLPMLKEMKASNSKLLIVDLRGNSGGSSSMSTILMYLLYGIDAILNADEDFVETMKYSHYYFETHDRVTLEGLSEGRRIPFEEDDYLFAGHDLRVQSLDEAEIRRSLRAELDKGAAAMPTFGELYATGEFEAFYCPERVVVLCDAGTFSAAYQMMYALYRAGATLVGTPSGQAMNVFGGAERFELENSGLSYYVSRVRFDNTYLDAASARALMPHHVMTYEKLASYDFDPNAEILWALELFQGK